VFAGRLADDRIIISGCEGVEIPFCEDVSRKGTGRAVWWALRYGGDYDRRGGELGILATTRARIREATLPPLPARCPAAIILA
jgi:hypothetical protein